MVYRSSDVTDRPRTNVKSIETDGYVEGSLATEVSFIVLDTLEQIVQVSYLNFHLILQRLFYFEKLDRKSVV